MTAVLDGDELVHAERILNKSFRSRHPIYTIAGDDARQVFLNW